MKLSKRVNRKVGEKVYHKWIVELPPDLVEQLGWEAGVELEPTATGDVLLLTKAG